MYETAQKYSEQGYYTKEAIANEIDSYLLEPIWQEVKTYRSFFRYDLKINDKVLYITRNPFVINKILQLEEQLKYIGEDTIICEEYYCPYLSDELNIMYRQYLTHLKLHTYIDFSDFFQTFCDQFDIQDIYKPHIRFLLNKEEPFLIRFFTLLMIPTRRSLHLFLLPFLISQKAENMYRQFSIIDFADSLSEGITGDATYMFLEMLDRLRLILYKNMLLLNSNVKDQYKVLQAQDLVERYPELNKQQIAFYVEHREIGHYYTIQNYIHQCKVCYETARYSLDELVLKHWYEKKKVGKKFVYYIV